MAFQSKSRLTNLVMKKMVDSCTFVRISVWAQNCFFEVKLKCLTGTAESAGYLGSQTLLDEAKIKTVRQLHTNDFTLYQQHIRDEGTTVPGFLWDLSSYLLCRLTGERWREPFFFLSTRSRNKKVFDPAQTPGAPLSFPGSGHTHLSVATSGSGPNYHMFSCPSFTKTSIS